MKNRKIYFKEFAGLEELNLYLIEYDIIGEDIVSLSYHIGTHQMYFYIS